MTVLYSWTALQFLKARRALYGYMHSTTTTPRRAWGDLQSTSHARRCYSLVARAWHHTPDLQRMQSKIAAGWSIVVFEYRFELRRTPDARACHRSRLLTRLTASYRERRVA
jgi:hypothetical protein